MPRIDPTDRSMPRVRITNVIPSARIPTIATWRSTLSKLGTVRKRSERNEAAIMSSTSAMSIPARRQATVRIVMPIEARDLRLDRQRPSDQNFLLIAAAQGLDLRLHAGEPHVEPLEDCADIGFLLSGDHKPEAAKAREIGNRDVLANRAVGQQPEGL